MHCQEQTVDREAGSGPCKCQEARASAFAAIASAAYLRSTAGGHPSLRGVLLSLGPLGRTLCSGDGPHLHVLQSLWRCFWVSFSATGTCLPSRPWFACSALAFNQPIGDWDVSSVTIMEYMFDHASAFNQPIGDWDVSAVTSIRYLFCPARRVLVTYHRGGGPPIGPKQ